MNIICHNCQTKITKTITSCHCGYLKLVEKEPYLFIQFNFFIQEVITNFSSQFPHLNVLETDDYKMYINVTNLEQHYHLFFEKSDWNQTFISYPKEKIIKNYKAKQLL